jgi:hypothetical protein
VGTSLVCSVGEWDHSLLLVFLCVLLTVIDNVCHFCLKVPFPHRELKPPEYMTD